MGWWDVLPDDERQHWSLDPFVSVGPLHFGIKATEVSGALDGAVVGPQTYKHGPAASGRMLVRERYDKTGLTLYYDQDERLCGISISGLRGPQVTVDGMALVGRVPSEVERWLIDRAETREIYTELAYMPSGDPGSRSLGVVVGVQRAGDRLVTRPMFLPAEGMDDPFHFLPREAWEVC